MNNQLSKGGEYASIEAFARSSKALHGQHHHLKTEQPEPTHERSPDPTHLRETWRKPRMHHPKLPDAFQVRSKKKKTNRELIDDLDRMVQHSRFKEFQKQLEPLGGAQPSSRPPPDNGNPLASYQKYLRIKSKFSEQMQERDLSLNKYKVLSSKQPAPAIKLSQCITLAVLKRGRHTGTVKKILHVPTLRVLCVREEPLNTKEARLAVKDQLVLWQGPLAQQPCFLRCHGGVYNVPEGAVSIITDFHNHGSLLDLLHSVMTLPESVIREIFPQVVEALDIFYQSSESAYGGLSPSQVLITEDSKICLGMGLYYHFGTTSASSIYGIKAHRANPMEFNATQKNFMRATIDKSTAEEERTVDVFKIGLMMLECAIGGFENFEQSPLLWEALRAVFTEEGQNTVKRDKACCLIHNQGYLLEWVSQSEERSRRDSINLSGVFPYLKFLKERFSVPFMGLLCDCLKLNHAKRIPFSALINHSYLRLQTPKQARTVGVNLNDLLEISSNSNQEVVESGSEEWGEKVIGHILHVLNGCRKEVLHDLLSNRREEISNLGKELGLSGLGIGEKLLIALNAMAKSDRRDLATSL